MWIFHFDANYGDMLSSTSPALFYRNAMIGYLLSNVRAGIDDSMIRRAIPLLGTKTHFVKDTNY